MVDVLVEMSLMAGRQRSTARQFLLAGGVAANGELRRRLRQRLAEVHMELIHPPVELCTDNGAMIAAAGYYYLRQGRRASWDLNAVPNLELVGV